jgi:hypothetical protein
VDEKVVIEPAPTETLSSHSSPPSPLPNKSPYSAYPSARRWFIIGIVTAAGFFGPLCGAVYLPSLILFQDIFNTSATAINATVSVYMVVFAIAVSHLMFNRTPCRNTCL